MSRRHSAGKVTHRSPLSVKASVPVSSSSSIGKIGLSPGRKTGHFRMTDTTNDRSSRPESGGEDPLHLANNDDHEDAAAASGDDEDERSLTLQVVDGGRHNNISSLTCAFLAALTTGGTTYAFGLYGDSLKKSLRLSQTQLDTISTANFCAGLFSWVPGLVVDKFGTRMGLVAGGIQGAVSLALYWGVATQFFVVPRDMLVATLSFLGVLIFLSCALITGSVFKIISCTCGPGSKGTAVGAAKGYVGLGAGVYASLFNSVRSKGQSE